jgi:hypothetical protein
MDDDAIGMGLIQAIYDGDIDMIRRILASNPALVNYHLQGGFTPLAVAVVSIDLYLVVLLRNRGADKMAEIRKPADRDKDKPKNAMELAAEVAEITNYESDIVLAIAFVLAEPGTPNFVKFEKQLTARAKDPAYHFESEDAESIARGAMEKRDVTDSILRAVEERVKTKVRGLKGKVMSELKAVPIPGAPEYEAAKAKFEGKGPGGRRTAIRKRKARKTRKTGKSRK